MSKKKVNVWISKLDIHHGIRHSNSACPIARGLDRKLGVFHHVFSTGFVESSPRNFQLPPKAVQFIKDFDMGRDVLPMSITLYIEEEAK